MKVVDAKMKSGVSINENTIVAEMETLEGKIKVLRSKSSHGKL